MKKLISFFLVFTLLFTGGCSYFSEAREEAFDDGWYSGLDQGRDAGYKEGYEDGYNDGYDEGYERGYALGLSDGTPAVSASVRSSAAPAQSSDGNYIGNLNTYKFHLPTCSSLPYPENRIYFDTRDEAISAGYEPCKKCNP